MGKTKEEKAKTTKKNKTAKAGKVVPVSKKAKAEAPKTESKKGAKATKATKPEKAPKAKAEKADSKKAPKENVGMYIVDGRLVKISWTEETDKKIKANSEVHNNSPLFKDRVHKFNEKLMGDYNKAREAVAKAEEKAAGILAKAGLHFGK